MGSSKKRSSTSQDSPPSKSPKKDAIFDAKTDFLGEKPPKDDTLDEKTDLGTKSMKPMERRKKRKAADKEKHLLESKTDSKAEKVEKVEKVSELEPKVVSKGLPEFHVGVFRDLSVKEAEVRKNAAEKMAVELEEVQRVYEEVGDSGVDGEVVKLEAEKDDGLEGCAPSLRYAVRRLIRGVSSSRECARQGFALGLSAVAGTISAIKVDPLMKLIVNLLEVPSSMKGQEVKECLLGRLFAYGSLARSGRLTAEWMDDNNTSSVKLFIGDVIALADKKRHLREPAVSVILDMVEKLPLEALLVHVLEAPGMHEVFQKAADIGDPDILFLALKLQEKVAMGSEIFGKLLPHPFTPDNFFTRDHLSYLSICFKESTFCHPRVHSLWPLLVNMLIPDMASQDEDATNCANLNRKHKKSRKGGSFEETMKNIRCFSEVVIDESLLLSSHERKNLALKVLLLLLLRLPASCIQIVLSYKLIHCLMDVLSTKGSWLYNQAQHFMQELLNWVGSDDDRRISVIVALQKHSSGRFDCITKTHTVKELVAKFNTGQGCLLFIQNLMSLFVEEVTLADEPSDQSQTTDENSEMGSVDDKDSPGASGNTDLLKNWIVDTMPRVLKNLKLDSRAKSWADTEIVKFIEEKFRVQAEILKFLAVQGLFSASLGTEVTSFELQEKFTWPKTAISSSLCRVCIEQLQLLLEDAQRGEVSNVVSNNGLERSDLGSYFMRFLRTMCNIPSVSLYRTLSAEDESAFRNLEAVESQLLHVERNSAGLEANKLHAMRYVLIQLVLQVLLCPGEFFEAAAELSVCCKKAFPAALAGDSSEEEDNDNEMPEMMDVLVETFLSLLPHSSGPMCFAIEQVFRLFCDDLTIDSLLRMLRVVRKDLKPLRHQTASSDDDNDNEDDDDFLEIKDRDEDEAKSSEADDGHKDDLLGVEANEEEIESDEGDSEATDEKVTKMSNDHSGSDDSDDDMDDDDAMFKKDVHLAQILKERNVSGSGKDSALSQLQTFKSRVLSLLEIYLQKNPGKSQVLMIYSFLVRAFVKYHTAKESKLQQQLGMRIRGILQKKIFKAKDYPKGDDIPLTSLEPLLERSLKAASRSSDKDVSSVARASTFWILKVIQSRNFDKSELKKVVEVFRLVLVDYFESKKSRLTSGFVKEVIRRHPWLGVELFGFLLEKCAGAKSEFRKIEALEVVESVMKSLVPTTKGEDASSKSSSKLLKKFLPALCDLIQVLLSRLPEKQSRRAEVRRFSTRTLHAISILNLKKPFLKALAPEAYSLCDTQLRDAFLPFKTSS